jgi:hypothetical protein
MVEEEDTLKTKKVGGDLLGIDSRPSLQHLLYTGVQLLQLFHMAQLKGGWTNTPPGWAGGGMVVLFSFSSGLGSLPFSSAPPTTSIGTTHFGW